MNIIIQGITNIKELVSDIEKILKFLTSDGAIIPLFIFLCWVLVSIW